jgi:Holliday junction resolvasome RuvABC endonuclease subunit
MKLLSFDQASKLGWALFDTDTKKLLEYGVENFSKVKDPDERLSKIKIKMNQLIKNLKAEVFSIEETQYQGMIKVYKNLCELMGVIKNNFYEQEMVYIIVKSSEWKGTCGVKGKKREEQKLNAQAFVKEKFGVEASEDICDAICQGWHVVTIIYK